MIAHFHVVSAYHVEATLQFIAGNVMTVIASQDLEVGHTSQGQEVGHIRLDLEVGQGHLDLEVIQGHENLEVDHGSDHTVAAILEVEVTPAKESH